MGRSSLTSAHLGKVLESPRLLDSEEAHVLQRNRARRRLINHRF